MNEHELKQKDTIIKLVDPEIEENDHVKQIYQQCTNNGKIDLQEESNLNTTFVGKLNQSTSNLLLEKN